MATKWKTLTDKEILVKIRYNATIIFTQIMMSPTYHLSNYVCEGIMKYGHTGPSCKHVKSIKQCKACKVWSSSI